MWKKWIKHIFIKVTKNNSKNLRIIYLHALLNLNSIIANQKKKEINFSCKCKHYIISNISISKKIIQNIFHSAEIYSMLKL